MQTIFKCVLYTAVALSSTACTTAQLISEGTQVQTRYIDLNLIEDEVVAFGFPKINTSEFAANSLVIAGKKQSYVITKGSETFVKAATHLNPQYVQKFDHGFRFLSKNNDGYFIGHPTIFYQVPEQLAHNDAGIKFLLEHGAEDCTSYTKGVKQYCLKLNMEIHGKVYPAVQNLSTLKPLGQQYKITVYTQVAENYKKQSYGLGTKEKVLLTPFTLVFDIVSFPFKLLTLN